jgi:MYXO-CTERM domain-containing protein
MRLTTPLMIAAAALVAASPAAAQNAAAPTNNSTTDAANTIDMNANGSGEATVANEPAAVGGAPATVAPSDDTSAANLAQPVQEEKHGFPWGVLGLLGLLGFVPRARRRS